MYCTFCDTHHNRLMKQVKRRQDWKRNREQLEKLEKKERKNGNQCKQSLYHVYLYLFTLFLPPLFTQLYVTHYTFYHYNYSFTGGLMKHMTQIQKHRIILTMDTIGMPNSQKTTAHVQTSFDFLSPW